MRNLILFVCLLLIGTTQTYSQTAEELQIMKAEKEAAIGALQGELDVLKGELGGIEKKLTIAGGWDTGTFGTLGFNFSSFNNWIKGANPNATSSAILASLNGFANKTTDAYFWRNAGNINLGWQKLDTNTDQGEDAKFEKVADVLKITSLYGYKLTDKLAISTLGEYNSSFLSDFNNPGVLDIGVGGTWTPIQNMVVVFHPLNYHWVFGDDPNFASALGAKLVVDYTKQFPGGISWRSNLTGFLSYKSLDPSLNEYTWTNGIAFSAWKGIGVGIEYAIRKANVEYNGNQSYFILGLSYAL